jgi:hypothetical protein
MKLLNASVMDIIMMYITVSHVVLSPELQLNLYFVRQLSKLNTPRCENMALATLHYDILTAL